MTQEDKQLLLKDLCARLPYSIFVKIRKPFGCVMSVEKKEFTAHDLLEFMQNPDMQVFPYLRSMSNMTNEEKREYNKLLNDCEEQDPVDYNITTLVDAMLFFVIDWLNAHHFDYRDLIFKGLALEAPEGMYSND